MVFKVKNYQSCIGNPMSDLYVDGKLTASKSYDKLCAIHNSKKYKKFLKAYPNEPKRVEI